MSSRRIAFLLALACLLTACEARDPAAPALEVPSALTASSGPSLLICPTNDTSSRAGTISPLGGLVSLDGHKVKVPLGGLLFPTTIEITEPASQYVEIALTANGLPHFDFELPVLVTVSYARCNRSNIDDHELEVWYIDSETHELLEPMGGIDNKLTRSISFFTNHFSGYAIADGPR
jgi:hypothetical protein